MVLPRVVASGERLPSVLVGRRKLRGVCRDRCCATLRGLARGRLEAPLELHGLVVEAGRAVAEHHAEARAPVECLDVAVELRIGDPRPAALSCVTDRVGHRQRSIDQRVLRGIEPRGLRDPRLDLILQPGGGKRSFTRFQTIVRIVMLAIKPVVAACFAT